MRPISSSALRGLRGPLRAAAGRGEPDQGVGDASQNPGDLFVALVHVVERIGRDDLRPPDGCCPRPPGPRTVSPAFAASNISSISSATKLGNPVTLSSAPARFRRWTHPPARRKDGDVSVQLSKGLGVPQVAGHIGAVRHLDANDVLVLTDELHQGLVRVGVLGSRVVLEDDQGPYPRLRRYPSRRRWPPPGCVSGVNRGRVEHDGHSCVAACSPNAR